MTFLRKIAWLFQRGRRERDLHDEIQFHLREEAEVRGSAGARRELGNLGIVEENARAAWSWRLVDQFVQDLRFGFRTMLRNRAFTTLAVLSLALGIGGNTAIYSFMDSILLRSLPVADPASLVVVNWQSRGERPNGVKGPVHVMHSASGNTFRDPQRGTTSGIFPYPVYELLAKDDSVFSSLFAFYKGGRRTLSIRGNAAAVSSEYVSGDYFRALGVSPAAGRLIVPDDDNAAAAPVAVISYGLSRRFGNPEAAIGQAILIDNQAFTVAGVAPPEFFGTDPSMAPDLFLPLHSAILLDLHAWASTSPDYADSNYYWIEMMGRLRPGVTLAQAQAKLAPLFHQWVLPTASREIERINLPQLWLREGAAGLDSLRRQYSQPLYVLMGMVGLILVIACANTANLLLARSAARRREMAVRLSMGAGRFRIVRQLLTESMLLAAIGGAIGTVFAAWGMRVLTLLLANGRENFTLRAELNWHVLAATFALSVISGALFGLAPALQSTRADVIPALKESRSDRRFRRGFLPVSLSQALIVAQIALSLLMLVGAGLFVRTLANLGSVYLGFTRENILMFDINARQAGHRGPEIARFYTNLRERFAAIPGVRAVSLSHASLLGAGRSVPLSVGGVRVEANILGTGPGFFSTMQIPILLGRELDERDRGTSEPVVVINELFAQRYFPGQNPLGRIVTLKFGDQSRRDMVIVGVSANPLYGGLKRELRALAFLPYNQGEVPPINSMTFAVRTAGEPLRYASQIRDIVHRADPVVPVTAITTQEAEIESDMNQEMIFARLCTGFAALALLIACVGLYGTMAYTVARRTSEIGIRMALGAQRGWVVWMVLREVCVLAAAGLAIAIPAALATSKLIASFLYGIQPNDTRTMAAAVSVLVVAALAAGYLPARKASRIDPIRALRYE